MNPGTKECKRTCPSWEEVTLAYWSKSDGPFFTIVELKHCPVLVLQSIGFEDGVYSSWYVLSPCTILWWRIVPMLLSIHRGWLCGGLIYSCNLAANIWKSELNLRSANFQRFKSAGVGHWMGNLQTSEWPGWSVSISTLIVLPSHRTISNLWITFYAWAWCSNRSDQVD